MKDFELIIIAAVAEHNVIGKGNKLPWHISDDLKHFKKLTLNHPIIMGSNTADSLPHALPNRVNVVLHEKEYVREGFVHFKSLESALEAVKEDRFGIKDLDCSKVYIIGGGMLYKYAMQFADKLEITHVKRSVDGDVLFPNIDSKDWKIESTEVHGDFDFVTYIHHD